MAESTLPPIFIRVEFFFFLRYFVDDMMIHVVDFCVIKQKIKSVISVSVLASWFISDLYVHLDDGLSNQGGTKEGPEGNHEMTAGYSSQVEKRIRDLEHTDGSEKC